MKDGFGIFYKPLKSAPSFKLQEERVRRVIEPVLAGVGLAEEFKRDDVEYVRDLGLIRQDVAGGIEIANPIYQEVIPRELGWTIQSGYSWMRQYHRGSAPAAGVNEAHLYEELKQLRQENKRLKQERDILKKAAAYFAVNQP